MDEKSRRTSSVWRGVDEAGWQAIPAGAKAAAAAGRYGRRDSWRTGAAIGADHRRSSNGIEQPGADGLGQHVGDAAQKSFLLPFGLAGGGVGDDGAFGVAPAKPFDDPDALDAHQVDVQNAGADQPVDQQRFGLPPRRGGERRDIPPDSEPSRTIFGEIWMRRQNQNGFHRSSEASDRRMLDSSHCQRYSTNLAQRSI